MRAQRNNIGVENHTETDRGHEKIWRGDTSPNHTSSRTVDLLSFPATQVEGMPMLGGELRRE
jgi:hypothetical protein